MGLLSRRRFLVRLATGAVGMALVACGIGRSKPIMPTPSPPGSVRSPTLTPVPSAPPVAASPAPTLPPLERQVGQLLLVGFRGLEAGPDAVITRDIAELGLGGVILFDRDQPTGAAERNIASPEQLRSLTAQLQATAAAAGVDLPLLVAIDQEGGRVARLGPRHGFAATESAAILGRRGDPADTEERAAALARTLADAGVTLNLAPVVDLDRNPANPLIGALERSFGADPAWVTRHAAATVRGHRAAGVLTALKHFPGHGSSIADSHLGLPDVTDTWDEVELAPYTELVTDGLADAVLTAHVYNARLDPEQPATLSGPIITGILRERIGYDGVVISDDLQMAAIGDRYGYEEAVAVALEAGVDLLTIANQQRFEANIVARSVDLIVNLVRSGRIGEARIAESWRRISVLKHRVLRPAA